MPSICAMTVLTLSALVLSIDRASAMEIDAANLFKDLDRNADGRLHPREVGEEHRLLFSRLLRVGDGDGDGALSDEELAAALEPVRAAKPAITKQGSRLPGADALLVMLAKMDANGDSQLEAGEIPKDCQRLFEQMLRPGDNDKNGKLDAREIARSAPRLGIICQMAAKRMRLDVAAELEQLPAERPAAMEQMDAYRRPRAAPGQPARAAAMFKRLDANGDGRISSDETPPGQAARFERMIRRGDRDGDGQISRRELAGLVKRSAIEPQIIP